MIRLRQSGADEILIKRVRDWYDPGPGCFFSNVTGVASFDPASLFTTGVNGVWYDPSDFSTLFQDAAGTTPVTAVEQPVGRMLDKSGRGNHAIQSASANRPTLSARYNLYVNTETLATQNVTTVAASYKLAFTGTGSITLSGTATGTYSAGTHTITCTAGTLTSTVSGTVTQADLRATNDALNQPAYQRVGNVSVTPSDYDTVGFKPYLKFNGTNQWLQTNSIDFTNTAQMFVSAGARTLTASDQIVLGIGPYASNNGSFALFSRDTGDGKSNFLSKGTVVSQAYMTTGKYFSPSTVVFSGVGDISGDKAILRINGAQEASDNTDQGSGNYGSLPLYIGSLNGSVMQFNGLLYGMVVAGKQASASEITNTETFINQKTGAY